MLTFTLVGPTIGATLDRLRGRAETTPTAQAEKAQMRQVDLQDLRERGHQTLEVALPSGLQGITRRGDGFFSASDDACI